jgi:hypothetical protein
MGSTPRSDGTQAPPFTMAPRLRGSPLEPSASACANAVTPFPLAVPE